MIKLSVAEAIIDLSSKLGIIYLIISIGVIWRFSRFYKDEYGKWLTQLTIWVLFPINILGAILGIESIDLAILIGIGVLATMIHIVSYASIVAIAKINSRNQESGGHQSIGAQAMTATFPNTLLYPFPIILAIVGDESLAFAAVFVFFVMLLRNTLGVVVGVQHSDPKDAHEVASALDLRKTIIEMTKFPPFIATLVGFGILLLFGPQDMGSPPIEAVKTISIWGSLLLVGISFQDLGQLKPKYLFSRETMEVASVRFTVAPVIGVIFVMLWGFPPLASFALLIQCMGPPAVANVLYGRFFGLPEDEISVYITSVTFLGLLILPLELLILLALFPVG
jgi:predicted permease